MRYLLGLITRHGQALMVLGLVAGFSLPGLAATLKPWLPEMVAGLLFLNAFRIGASRALGGLRDGVASLQAVLTLQMILPLAAAAVFALLGLTGTAVALAVVLMLSAPALTGSPNITQLLGYAPDPAFRLLILGTALMPLTVLPVFLALPEIGSFSEILWASLRLTGSIAVIVTLAFTCRLLFLPKLSEKNAQAVDGLTILMLAVIVVGLMAALGPALKSTPWVVAKWMVLALLLNFGLQLSCFTWLQHKHSPRSVPISVVAGNRNFALFLIALPTSTTDPLLIFLGCYQVPMYLTPLIMRRLYAGQAAPREH